LQHCPFQSACIYFINSKFADLTLGVSNQHQHEINISLELDPIRQRELRLMAFLQLRALTFLLLS
jgi:hypothetical protein